jgi:hypothetical protein
VADNRTCRPPKLAAGFTLIGLKPTHSAQADHRLSASATGGRLRQKHDAMAYPDADLFVRSSKFLLRLEHYWYWTKRHYRERGFNEVAKRAFRRLGLGFLLKSPDQ